MPSTGLCAVSRGAYPGGIPRLDPATGSSGFGQEWGAGFGAGFFGQGGRRREIPEIRHFRLTDAVICVRMYKHEGAFGLHTELRLCLPVP